MKAHFPASTLALRRGAFAARGRLWPGLCLAAIVLFSALAACPSVAGQNPAAPAKTSAAPEGSIRGTVRDTSGAAISAARVTLIPDVAGARRSAVTDAKGNFMFTALPLGTYTLEVRSAGFRKSMRSHLVVNSHQDLTADFTLALAPTSNHPPDSSLGGFDYYDDTEFKPGAVGVAVDPGGYSATREVDSYRLMLDYAQAEGAASGDNRRSGVEGPNGQGRAAPVSPPTALELDSWDEDQFLARGSGLLLGHDLAASIDAFQAGVARFPNSAKLATGLGIALAARGEYEKSITSLLRATDLAPSDPRPYFVLAQAYRGSPAPADEVPQRIERLVALQPQNAQARYYCALALAKTRPSDPATLKQAESLLQSAVALDPNFAEAHLELGILYAARSSYPEAIAEYQSAIRLKPSLAAAHYRLAQAYARSGDKPAAQAELDLYERLRQPASSSPH